MNDRFGPPANSAPAIVIPPVCDVTVDVSDYVAEVIEGFEDVAEALFNISYESGSLFRPCGHGLYREEGYTYDLHRLIGMTVEDTDEIRFFDRAEVEALLGREWIAAREDEMDETAE